MLRQQKRAQLPILNIDFAIENKTQTQQIKHSVLGIFCSNLYLNTAGKKGRYTLLSNIISRVFQRSLMQIA